MRLYTHSNTCWPLVYYLGQFTLWLSRHCSPGSPKWPDELPKTVLLTNQKCLSKSRGKGGDPYVYVYANMPTHPYSISSISLKSPSSYVCVCLPIPSNFSLQFLKPLLSRTFPLSSLSHSVYPQPSYVHIRLYPNTLATPSLAQSLCTLLTSIFAHVFSQMLMNFPKRRLRPIKTDWENLGGL